MSISKYSCSGRMKVNRVSVSFILMGKGRTWYTLYLTRFVQGKRIRYTRNLSLMNTSKSTIFTIRFWWVAFSGIGRVSSPGVSVWLAFNCFTFWAGVIIWGYRIPLWEFKIASIKIPYSLLHSFKALSNCVLCSLTVSSIEVLENISLISPSCSRV